MYTFDSYAWLEYFLAGTKGKEVLVIVNSKEQILTPSIALAEIKVRLTKDKIDAEQIAGILDFIGKRSKILNINKEISLLAANLKIKHNLYLIDALIYASAIFTDSELLTGDLHLKGFDKIKFLE